MAMNLIANIQAALNFLPHEMHCCLDSTIALYWITGQGEYRQFVSNRVHKIQQHNQARWHHVPTADNPANLGSRGGNAVDSHLWKNGPTWLSDPSNWPPDIVLEPTTETTAEAKVNQEVFSITIPKQDALDHMLSNHALPRVLRIGAWVWQFIHNCRNQARNNDECNQYWRNTAPRNMVDQTGSKLISPATQLPSKQTSVEPPVKWQASLRMLRKNYRVISNLPPRQPPLHRQIGLQWSLSYSTWWYQIHHDEGTQEILGTPTMTSRQEVEK